MAEFKLIIVESAIIEIEDACIYYNNQLVGLGYEFEEEIFTLLELINGNPLLFPIKFAYFREATVKRFPFIIIYEIVEKEIIVTAIFHTKQSPDKKARHKY